MVTSHVWETEVPMVHESVRYVLAELLAADFVGYVRLARTNNVIE